MDSTEALGGPESHEERLAYLWDRYAADLVLGVKHDDDDLDWDATPATQDHTEKPQPMTLTPAGDGEPRMPGRCPVALALMADPDIDDVLVGRVSVRVRWMGLWYHATLPDEYRQAIRRFDYIRGGNEFDWQSVAEVPIGPWRRWSSKPCKADRVGAGEGDGLRRVHLGRADLLHARMVRESHGTTEN